MGYLYVYMKLLDIIFESVVEGKQLYTDDDIEKEAKKKDEEDNYVYKQREDFKRGSYWAWRAASQRGILDKLNVEDIVIFIKLTLVCFLSYSLSISRSCTMQHYLLHHSILITLGCHNT